MRVVGMKTSGQIHARILTTEGRINRNCWDYWWRGRETKMTRVFGSINVHNDQVNIKNYYVNTK